MITTTFWRKTLLAVAIGATFPAFADDTVSEEALEQSYQEALSLRANGDLYGSIEALSSLLTTQPDLHRARMELAVAYYRAARYAEAKANAEKVMANEETPEKIKETIQLFLDQLASIQEADDKVRHVFNGSVGMGFGHDDNVNAGPSSDTVEINGTEFSLASNGNAQSDSFGTVNASISHKYRIPGSFNIGDKPVQAQWQSNLSLLRKEYNDEHQFTVDVASLSTGLALISRTNWRAKVNVQTDYIRLGDDALALFTSLNPSYTLVSNKSEFTVRGQWMYREYMTDANKAREGDRYALGLDWGYRLTDKVTLQTGFTAYEQETRTANTANDSHEMYVGALWSAWNNGSIYTRATFKETDYEGEIPLHDYGRVERQQAYVLGAYHNFTEGSLAGFSLGARLSYTDNHANTDLYEYDRNNFTVNVTKRF